MKELPNSCGCGDPYACNEHLFELAEGVNGERLIYRAPTLEALGELVDDYLCRWDPARYFTFPPKISRSGRAVKDGQGRIVDHVSEGYEAALWVQRHDGVNLIGLEDFE